MKRFFIYLLIAAILLISLRINFDQPTITILLIRTIITFLLIIVPIVIIYYIFISIKKRQIAKTIILTLMLIAMLSGLIMYHNHISIQKYPICQGLPSEDLERNILTGECRLVVRHCGSIIPWYIKGGCDISEEEKIAIKKEQSRLNQICESYCQEGNETMYCDQIGLAYYMSYITLSIKMPCTELVQCETITCPETLQ